MENQHRKITGYRELSQEEIDLMNEIKATGEQLEKLIEKVSGHIENQVMQAFVIDADSSMTIDCDNAEVVRITKADPRKWVRIAEDHLQQGLMALTRAVEQPTSF